MMRRLFGDRSRPFYGQSRAVRLGPLPEDALSEYIDDRFARSGRQVGDVLEPLLATARGHPQRAMLLAQWAGRRRAADPGRGCARLGPAHAEGRLVDPLLALWIDSGRDGLGEEGGL